MTLTPERRSELRSQLGYADCHIVPDAELAALLDAADEAERFAAENANLKGLLVMAVEELADLSSDKDFSCPACGDVLGGHADGCTLMNVLNAYATLAPAPEPIALPPGDRLPRLDEAETKEKP